MDESFTLGNTIFFSIVICCGMFNWEKRFCCCLENQRRKDPGTRWIFQNFTAWRHVMKSFLGRERLRPLLNTSVINDCAFENSNSNISCELTFLWIFCAWIWVFWKSKDSCKYNYFSLHKNSRSWYLTVNGVSELRLQKAKKIQIRSLFCCIFLAAARMIVCRETKDCTPGLYWLGQ